MEMVVGNDEVLPITIPQAISSLKDLVMDVVRKNRTMVDYYIYPKPTPSEIEAYKPRLQALYGRLESLQTLDLTKLPLIADNAQAFLAAFLLPIIDQLLNAVHGIQSTFINHYDRDLEYRKPYGNVYNALEYRERQLKQFSDEQMRNPQRRTPESMLPMPPNPLEPSFCRYAIAYVNHRDAGKLAQVMSEELTGEERDKLRTSGGAYLAWDCPGCAFKLKYYVSNSNASNLQLTDDIRSHAIAPDIEYRPAFLIKCHLYQMKPRTRSDAYQTVDYRGVEERRPNTRRNTESRNTSRRNSFFFPSKKRTTSEIVKDTYSTGKSKLTGPKYGCPFCFVTGKEYGHMEYRSAKEFAEHIESRHHVRRPPSNLMLEKYMVGLNGKCADNVRRWDLVGQFSLKGIC